MLNQKQFIVGYYPLLYPHHIGIRPGQFVDPIDIIEQLSNIDEIDISSGGIIWSVQDGVVTPIMVFKSHAVELAEHIKYWCDGDNSRMSLQFQMHDDQYAMIVMPDITRIIERVKLASLVYESDTVVKDDVSIIYKPLTCYCPRSDSYRKLIENFPDVNSMRLKFIELTCLENTDMSKIDFINDSIDVGTFEVKKPDAISQEHFNGIFEN